MNNKHRSDIEFVKTISEEVRAIQLFSTSVIYSAAAVASSTILLFIPNLETLSLIFFIVGYRYGLKTGTMTILTSVTIYEMFASQVYGTGGIIPFLLKFPPFFLIMFAGVYFHYLKNKKVFHKRIDEKHSIFNKNGYEKQEKLLYIPHNIIYSQRDSEFSLYERFLLGQLGIALTMIYDVFTSFGILVFVPSWESFFIMFITGIPFLIFHQITNFILFSTIPSIIIALDKARTLN